MTRPRIVLVWALPAAFLSIFILMELAGGSTNPEVLDRFGAQRPDRTFGPEAWRLVSSGFLHIGLVHLLVNGWALFAIGPYLEAGYGRRGLWSIFVLSVAGGGLASTVIGQGGAGASGGLFGMIAMYVVHYIRHRSSMDPAERTRMGRWLTSIVVLNVFVAISIPNIGHAAHLGGFLVGIACGLLLKPASREGRLQAGATWVVVAVSAGALGLAALNASRPAAERVRVWHSPDARYRLVVPSHMPYSRHGDIHAFLSSEYIFGVQALEAAPGWLERERAGFSSDAYANVRFTEDDGGRTLVVRATIPEGGDELEARILEKGGRLYRFTLRAPSDRLGYGRDPFLRFVKSLEVR